MAKEPGNGKEARQWRGGEGSEWGGGKKEGENVEEETCGGV